MGLGGGVFWRLNITIYSYTIFHILQGVRIMVIREMCNIEYTVGVT